MTVGGLSKRLIHSRIAILLATLAGLSAGTTIALLTSFAASAEEEQSYGEVLAGETYQVVDGGLAFECQQSQCAIKARIFLSAAAARYLGLKSQTLASGTAQGPVAKHIEGVPYEGLYLLKLPASLGRELKAKHVVAMKLSVTGTATYPVVVESESKEEGSGSGSGSTTKNYTQKINDVGNSQVQLGQGRRFGCFEVGGLLIGYVKQGGTCPKHS